MRKFVVLFLVLFLGCSTVDLYEIGNVALQKNKEVIPIRIIRDLPFVTVKIEGNEYNFLIDTGAATSVSQEIYEKANLKGLGKTKITDSQNRTRGQVYTTIPLMEVENVIFKNIGAIVLNFDQEELNCLKIDGILGANQMAKLYWKFNYINETIEISKDKNSFDLTEFPNVIPFKVKNSKTPVVLGKYFDNETYFTFDTGYGGQLKISNKDSSVLKKISKQENIMINGIGGFGIYGGVYSEKFIFESDIKFADNEFEEIIFQTGEKNLLGGEFLKNFEFIIDWNEHNIYLKKLKEREKIYESFGFHYGKNPEIILLHNTSNIPLQLGDSILQINDKIIQKDNDSILCKDFIKRFYENEDSIRLRIKRNDSIFNILIQKKVYFK